MGEALPLFRSRRASPVFPSRATLPHMPKDPGTVPRETRPPHRPTVLTPALEATLLTALRATPVKKYAAEHAGISQRTWHSWEAKGLAALPELAAAHNTDPDELTLDHITFDENPYVHFLLSVRKQRSDYLLLALGRIQEAGTGYDTTITRTKTYKDKDGEAVTETTVTNKRDRFWQASAWLVERQYPEFRIASKVEISGPDGGPVEISEESAADRLNRLLGEMVERESAREELLAVDDPGETVENPET